MKKVSAASKIYLVLVFIFLYAPLFVMILISFNGGESTTVMNGFSLRWYKEMLRGINRLQIPKNRFDITVSPMEIRYRKTGNTMYFAGSDGRRGWCQPGGRSDAYCGFGQIHQCGSDTSPG